MNEILSDKIAKLTGRKVIAFNSQILFDPDISIEILVVDAAARRSDRFGPRGRGRSARHGAIERFAQDRLEWPIAARKGHGEPS